MRFKMFKNCSFTRGHQDVIFTILNRTVLPETAQIPNCNPRAHTLYTPTGVWEEGGQREQGGLEATSGVIYVIQSVSKSWVWTSGTLDRWLLSPSLSYLTCELGMVTSVACSGYKD